MRRSRWVVGLVGLMLLATLALVGHWARRLPAGRCALDGVLIEPLYRVRIRDGQSADHLFCCLRCAELWLGRHALPPLAIYVTDEATGKEVKAAEAFFVRSRVVTTATTGNRVHAFAHQADADRHAEFAHGHVLLGSERPFVTAP